METISFPDLQRRRPRWTQYALLAGLAAGLPPILWLSHSPLLGNSYGPNHLLFELFGFCTAPVLLAAFFLELGKAGRRSWAETLPLLCFLATGFYFLNFFVEFSTPSFDYGCFERGAQALAGGQPLYGVEGYFYPPLRAQAMAAVFRLLQGVAPLPPEALWYGVFYLYQCVMYASVLLCWWLCYRLALSRGLKPGPAALLATLILIVNAPVLRNLRHQQVNVLLLDLMLVPLFLPRRFAWLAGLCLALGVHLKLYPLLLLAPLLVCRQWGTAAWFSGWTVGLALPALPWLADFARFFRQFPPGQAFRDNSWHSLFYNCLDLAHRAGGPAFSTASAAWLARLAALGMLIWFAMRLWKHRASQAAGFRAAWMDSLAFMLLVSPMVWEHHYVLALPLAIGVLALADPRRPLLPLLAVALVFAVPVFDVFPFSYHRLAGLLLLLHLAPPFGRDNYP